MKQKLIYLVLILALLIPLGVIGCDEGGNPEGSISDLTIRSGGTLDVSSGTLTTGATQDVGQSKKRDVAYVFASNAPFAPSASDTENGIWVCDGTADHVQINAVIDVLAATDTGGIAQLSGGNFVGGTILLKEHVVLRGAGPYNTVYTLADGTNDNIMSSPGDDEYYGVQVLDMSLNGNASNQSAGRGIVCTGFKWFTFDNCQLTNCFDDGVYAEIPGGAGEVPVTFGAQISHNIINSNGGHGVELNGGYGWSIFDNPYIGGNTGNGVTISGGGEGNISGNDIDQNTGHGCQIYAGDRINFVNNFYVGDNGKAGLALQQGANDILISGNQFLENGSTGVAPAGIYLSDACLRTTIIGNHCYDNGPGDQDYGVQLSADTVDCNIWNNDLSGNIVSGVSFAAGADFKSVNNDGYIGRGEVKTITGTVAVLTENAFNSLDNPLGQNVRVLSLDIYVATGATATSPNIDCGIGSSATTDYTTLFDDLPGESFGFYNSVNTTTYGQQTSPQLWESGSGNRYLNMSIKGAAATGMVATYAVTVMGM